MRHYQNLRQFASRLDVIPRKHSATKEQNGETKKLTPEFRSELFGFVPAVNDPLSKWHSLGMS